MSSAINILNTNGSDIDTSDNAEQLISVQSDETLCTADDAEDPTFGSLSVLTDESWKKVDTHIRKAQRELNKEKRSENEVTPTPDDLRKILRGIYYRFDTGSKWKEIPEEYGSYTTIHRYFRYWLEIGLIAKVNRLIRKEENKNMNELFEKIRVTPPPKPEPSDFQKATRAVDSLGRSLEHLIYKLPLAFDFLTDEEQLGVIAFLENELEVFAKVLRYFKVGKKTSEDITLFLKKERDNKYTYPIGIISREVRDVIWSIAFYVNICLDEVATVFDNLTDDEKSTVSARLEGELQRLDVLLNEIKEIEHMNEK